MTNDWAKVVCVTLWMVVCVAIGTTNQAFAALVTDGLVGHFRADLGVTDDGNGRASVWADQATADGSQDATTTAVSTARPTIHSSGFGVQNRAYLDFDGSDDRMFVSGNPFFTGGESRTMFAVYDFDVEPFLDGPTHHIIGKAAPPNTVGTWFNLDIRNGGDEPYLTVRNLDVQSNNVATLDGGINISMGMFDDDTDTITMTWLNNSQLGISSGQLDTSPDDIGIGARASAAPSTFFGGKIAEVLVYDRALTAAELAQNADAFNQRYLVGGAPETDFTWNAGSGDWNVPGNWNPIGTPGTGEQSSSHTVTFADSIGSESRTVFTDQAVTVNRISFANTMGGSYRIAGGPSINLAASTSLSPVTPFIGVSQGSHRFQAAVNLHSDTIVEVATGSMLIFDGALSLMGNTLSKGGEGTLAIRNDLVTGGGTVNVLLGTVSGNGTIGGDLNNDGGTISPGNSPGTIVVPEPATWVVLALGLAGCLALLPRHQASMCRGRRIPSN